MIVKTVYTYSDITEALAVEPRMGESWLSSVVIAVRDDGEILVFRDSDICTYAIQREHAGDWTAQPLDLQLGLSASQPRLSHFFLNRYVFYSDAIGWGVYHTSQRYLEVFGPDGFAPQFNILSGRYGWEQRGANGPVVLMLHRFKRKSNSAGVELEPELEPGRAPGTYRVAGVDVRVLGGDLAMDEGAAPAGAWSDEGAAPAGAWSDKGAAPAGAWSDGAVAGSAIVGSAPSSKAFDLGELLVLNTVTEELSQWYQVGMDKVWSNRLGMDHGDWLWYPIGLNASTFVVWLKGEHGETELDFLCHAEFVEMRHQGFFNLHESICIDMSSRDGSGRPEERMLGKALLSTGEIALQTYQSVSDTQGLQNWALQMLSLKQGNFRSIDSDLVPKADSAIIKGYQQNNERVAAVYYSTNADSAEQIWVLSLTLPQPNIWIIIYMCVGIISGIVFVSFGVWLLLVFLRKRLAQKRLRREYSALYNN